MLVLVIEFLEGLVTYLNIINFTSKINTKRRKNKMIKFAKRYFFLNEVKNMMSYRLHLEWRPSIRKNGRRLITYKIDKTYGFQYKLLLPCGGQTTL